MAKKLSKKQQIIEMLIQVAYDKATTNDRNVREECDTKYQVLGEILKDVFDMDGSDVYDIFQDNYTMYRQMNRY